MSDDLKKAEEIETSKAIAVDPWCYRIGKRDGEKDLWGIKKGYKQQLGILESRIVELKSKLSEERARTLNSEAVHGLRNALKLLYDNTADYIRINNLGDVHHNQDMQMARECLEKFQQFKDAK